MPLCCINMGLPTCNKVQSATGINMNIVKKTYRTSLIIWSVIDIVVFTLVILFVPQTYALALLIGSLFSVLLGYKQTKLNDNNISDFLRVALPHFTQEEQNKIIACFK